MFPALVPAPPVLYHYTNSAGLKGILETNSLWATATAFLNDSLELQFGRPQLCDALQAQAESLDPGDRNPDGGPDWSRAAIIRSAVDYLRRGDANSRTNAGQVYDAISRANAEQVYVACFCDHDDLLSQWRGYGSSAGYAIGFRSESLPVPAPSLAEVPFIRPDGLTRVLDPSQPPESSLVQVQYGESAIIPMVDQVLKQMAQRPSGHPGSTGWAEAVLLAEPALASIKHEAFAEEREWRLLTAEVGSRTTGFRVTALGLVPYIELPVNLRGALHEIVVGPGNHSDVRMLGLARMLQHLGLREVSIRASSVPYRG